jgi:hypothetical protein
MIQEGGSCGSSPDISINPQHPKRGQIIIVKVSRLDVKAKGCLQVSHECMSKLERCAEYAWVCNTEGVATIRIDSGELPHESSEFTLVLFRKGDQEEKEILRERVTLLDK